MKKQYRLLQYHMACNPDYMFGHAIVAGMLASNDERVSTEKGYISQCNIQGITYYNGEVYNEFMADCGRTSHLPNPVITYLVANSPWSEEDLIKMSADELTSLAYSYNYPNAPKPIETHDELIAHINSI